MEMTATSGPGDGLGAAARLRVSVSSLVSSVPGVVEGLSRGHEISGRLPAMLVDATRFVIIETE